MSRGVDSDSAKCLERVGAGVSVTEEFEFPWLRETCDVVCQQWFVSNIVSPGNLHSGRRQSKRAEAMELHGLPRGLHPA